MHVWPVRMHCVLRRADRTTWRSTHCAIASQHCTQSLNATGDVLIP